jgi:hypothetical protein
LKRKNLLLQILKLHLLTVRSDLDNKKSELDEIISDTQKEEEGLYKKV